MKRPARELPGEPSAAPEDVAIFRAEMRDVAPAPPANRVEPWRRRPAPVPAQRLRDERAVIEELARLGTDGDEVELEDDSAYLRPGLPRDILRKLRRAHWTIQDQVDLHGLTAEEAARATARFLADCLRRGVRCVRIVHGKGLGSRGREPVLKRRIRRLLARRSEVLAFVEPRAVHGGGGAVVALLDA
ncbi:MAG TPA: Smr/MutS family protein [Usitatibacter sp.]|nr:Smr/MutS family protein [Usitatibacter sp.]